MTDFWNDRPSLRARLERVAVLIDGTARAPGFPLGDAVAAIAGANGKLLRPAFLLLGASFGRPDWERITPLAAAIELLHVSTLIHDDVIDEAELRRGAPTVHSRFGAKDAILAGDWLFARCFWLASRSASPGNAEALARLVSAICAAEIAQDLDKWRWSPSLRAYRRKIAGKTAALFSLALFAGADEARAPARVAWRLRRAGYDIGMAFQVMDDVLDFESTEAAMGKPVGKDIAEGLCTLPLIHALRADPTGMAALLAPVRGADGRVDQAAVKAVIARTAELGGVAAARREAESFTARALAEIGRLPPGPARQELADTAAKLLSRRS